MSCRTSKASCPKHYFPGTHTYIHIHHRSSHNTFSSSFKSFKTYQVSYPSDGQISRRLCGGFLWNRHPAVCWGKHICSFPGPATQHTAAGLMLQTHSQLRYYFWLSSSIHLVNFHLFGTFLSLKSVLVESGKWAQKGRGDESAKILWLLKTFYIKLKMPTPKKCLLKYILSTKHSMQMVNVPQGTENLEKDVFRLLFLGPASIFSFPH